MPNEKAAFSFLQISDILLDAKFSFKDMEMPVSKRHERNVEALESVLGICKIAKDRQADALVVVGNLWDGQSLTASTVACLVDAFAALGETPVLIVPGAADPLNPQSFYNANVLSAFALRPWSKNVRILGGAEASLFQLPSCPDAYFTFGGQPDPQAVAELQTSKCLIGLALVESKQQMVEFVAGKKVDYTAFGGMLNFVQVDDEQGNVRGAASGTLIGRSLTEAGTRSALWVQLTAREHGTGYDALVERITSDRRSIVSVPVKINGIKGQNICAHIKKAVAASACGDGDLLHLRLSGIHSAERVLDLGVSELQRLCFHLILEDRTRPDYYLDKMDPRTTEGRFIQFLQDMKVRAESRGNSIFSTEYDTELTPSIIEDALYFGLESLNQKKVTVPDVD